MSRYRFMRSLVLSGSVTLLASLPMIDPSVAQAGATIKIDEVRSLNIGMRLRSSFNMEEDAAPSGKDRSKEFALDNFHFYLSGQLHQGITFEFNTDYNSRTSNTTNESVRLLTGVIKFGFNDYVNLWVGRFLPPSDRSNLSGPFYLNAWDFPFVQMYPNVFSGRDDGASLWGQVGGGKFKYQVGAFNGTRGGSNQKDNLLYAGRLTLNLWDPEPGYYNSSTYYGAANILAVGLAGMTQKNNAGTVTTPGDFTGWNVDLLAERTLGEAGVATLEGAYYHYDKNGVDKLNEGKGYFALASYLLPWKVGGDKIQGQFQPGIRYQQFDDEDLSTNKHSRLDISLGYIIAGHNARITAAYSKDDPAAAGAKKFDIFKIGLQFQI